MGPVGAGCPNALYAPAIEAERSATPLLIIVMVMVFPVLGILPVVFFGDPWREPALIDHGRLGDDHRRRLHDDGCRLHNDRSRGNDDGRGKDHHWDRDLKPNTDVDVPSVSR